jgi:hypothetical protein
VASILLLRGSERHLVSFECAYSGRLYFSDYSLEGLLSEVAVKTSLKI